MEKIDLAEAKEMVARYQATRKELVDSTYGINDTKSIWIPVADIKDLVNNLPESATGLRIYLAAYGDDQAPYPKQTTIVTVATVANEGGIDIDVIEHDSPLLSDDKFDPKNHDTVCPPICPWP